MRRLWPLGITGRVALILIVCLLAVQAVVVVFFIREQSHAAFRVLALTVAEQVVASVELMERTPPADRPKLLRALNGATLWVDLADERPARQKGEWRHSRAVGPALRRHLRALGDRPIDIQILDRRWRALVGRGRPDRPDLLPSRRKIALSVGLADGTWMVFVVSSEVALPAWGLRMALWILVTGIVILLFAIWAARRVTKPLVLFSQAADRLGVDVNAPPLPEAGSRELRRAIHAFNRMQHRLRRFVEDRTQMLAAISHDLRTALTRLKLRAEFIADAEQREKAVADIDEMEAMLYATLTFARDDTESEARTKLDIAALLRSLCDDLADTGQPVSYEGPDRLTLACRPVAMRRALANLIDNAVKYGGEAEVALARAEESAEIAIRDRGPGVPAAMRERVFDPFFRLEPSRSRETGGTGLGLAVARSIIRRHGGDIFLEDRPGGGLTVRVALPLSTD